MWLEASMSVALPRHLFTSGEFRAMVGAGVFRGDARLELVDGEIVEMSPIGSRHAACVRKLNRLLRAVGDRAWIDVQNPLGISEDNDYYPDVVLLKPRADEYVAEVPDSSAALLVIEVADTTLQFDRNTKKPRYAAAGVSDLWIVDLEGTRVWVHRKPVEGDYREVSEARPGDVLKVPGMPDVEIPVSELLT
jgi:Uma2 family endonuclease